MIKIDKFTKTKDLDKIEKNIINMIDKLSSSISNSSLILNESSDNIGSIMDKIVEYKSLLEQVASFKEKRRKSKNIVKVLKSYNDFLSENSKIQYNHEVNRGFNSRIEDPRKLPDFELLELFKSNVEETYLSISEGSENSFLKYISILEYGNDLKRSNEIMDELYRRANLDVKYEDVMDDVDDIVGTFFDELDTEEREDDVNTQISALQNKLLNGELNASSKVKIITEIERLKKYSLSENGIFSNSVLTNSYIIRKSTKEDVDGIFSLLNSIDGNDAQNLNLDKKMDTLKLSIVSAKNIYVITENDIVVGFAKITPMESKGGILLDGLYISPQMRGKKIPYDFIKNHLLKDYEYVICNTFKHNRLENTFKLLNGKLQTTSKTNVADVNSWRIDR